MASSVKWVFCKQNLEKHSQRVYDALVSKYPEEKVDIKECAGADLCSLCMDVPFVLRNGSILHAKDERDLYFKIDSSMQFLSRERLVPLPPAPPAADKDAAPKPAAAPKAAAPKAEVTVKAEAAPKADAAPAAEKAEAAPKADAAPAAEKAEVAPKADAASKQEEAPQETKADESPKLD
ncbi:DUF1450 domain-containing protein [Tumebacillus lipolyticus]|uniref:DUF1450 domain-containing protein n=1 Tax=Tumebacillus lipolyticus TaxID=1280370 RepID=A0ABW4ZTK5_9BACL